MGWKEGSGAIPEWLLTERCEICDHVSSNSIPPCLRTTEPTSFRQQTAPSTTANSAGAPPRSPAPVSTEGRRGVGGSLDGQDEQSRCDVKRSEHLVFGVCQGLQGNEPVGLEKSIDQRIVTGRSRDRISPCMSLLQKAQPYWNGGDIGFLRSR